MGNEQKRLQSWGLFQQRLPLGGARTMEGSAMAYSGTLQEAKQQGHCLLNQLILPHISCCCFFQGCSMDRRAIQNRDWIKASCLPAPGVEQLDAAIPRDQVPPTA